MFVPTERILTRNAGCWNCIHMRDATDFWFGDPAKGTHGRRGETLDRAVALALESPRGENDPRVVNIRRMIQIGDEGVRQRAMIKCGPGYAEGDLVASSYMCTKWTGATGASIALGGERINDLAEELREKIDGSPKQASAKLDEIVQRERERPHYNECVDPNCKGCA